MFCKAASIYLTEAAAGAYVNYSGESEDLAGLLELNKQFAGMANIKKASVENIKGKDALMIESDIKNITFELKLPLKKSELLPQESVDEENLKDQVHFTSHWIPSLKFK